MAHPAPSGWAHSHTGQVVSGSVAGAMLGCTRQNVRKLIRYGHLTTGPDGGVTVDSIRDCMRASALAERSSTPD
jgi:biotin operon repressor